VSRCLRSAWTVRNKGITVNSVMLITQPPVNLASPEMTLVQILGFSNTVLPCHCNCTYDQQMHLLQLLPLHWHSTDNYMSANMGLSGPRAKPSINIVNKFNPIFCTVSVVDSNGTAGPSKLGFAHASRSNAFFCKTATLQPI